MNAYAEALSGNKNVGGEGSNRRNGARPSSQGQKVSGDALLGMMARRTI